MSNFTRAGRKLKVTPINQSKHFFTIKAALALLIFTLLFSNGITAQSLCGSTNCPNYPRAARTSDDTQTPKRWFADKTVNGLYLTNYNFNENQCLSASKSFGSTSRPAGTVCDSATVGTGFKIRLWYNDEWPITLGIGRFAIKDATHPTFVFQNSPVTSYPTLQFGFTGVPDGNDPPLSGFEVVQGRPLRPQLFVTDVTTEKTEPYKGDWQQKGGVGLNPTSVIGTFISGSKTIDYTANPPKVTIDKTLGTIVTETRFGSFPLKNYGILGPGNAPPTGTVGADNYPALVEWNIDDFPTMFEKGHDYRLQFMVHDGDQNKAGGDVGERCGWVHINNPVKLRCGHFIACANSTFVTTDLDPFEASINYAWSIESNPVGASTILGVSANGYTVSVSTGSSGGFKLFQTKSRDGFVETCFDTVTIIPKPTCTITPPGPVCANHDYVYSVNVPSPSIPQGIYPVTIALADQVLWSISGDGDIIGPKNLPTVTVHSHGSGNFTLNVDVTRTASDDLTSINCNGGCSAGPILIDNCDISLTKTPDVCEVVIGVSTPVTYTYVVTNNAHYLSAKGNLRDDNGSPTNISDDFEVCIWGTDGTPLAPGASRTCQATRNLTGARTNIATAYAQFISAFGTAEARDTAKASATVNGHSCFCDILSEYPKPFDASHPRTSVKFNEPECASASSPSPTECGTPGDLIRLWYIDEHAMCMGVNKIIVKTSAGFGPPVISDIDLPPLPYNPGKIGFKNGPVETSGDDGALDGNGKPLPNYEGRPMRPSLFITDITGNPNNRDGDWQYGGQSYDPTTVEGTWKGTSKTIDKTTNPWKITFSVEPNPAENPVTGLSVQPPTGTKTNKFNSLITWDPAQIGYPFQAGHSYRLQFMVHDGDLHQSGGDIGEKCSTYFSPNNTPPCATPKTDEAESSMPSANGPVIAEAKQESAAQFSIYPNPATEKLNLAFISPNGGNARISMTDVNGKLLSDLYNGKVESGQINKTTVDMNNFATGVYIIQFKCHDSIITKKLILEK